MHVAALSLVLLNVLVNFYGFFLSCLFAALFECLSFIIATDGFAESTECVRCEKRKKQIMNSTVANGDGPRNEGEYSNAQNAFFLFDATGQGEGQDENLHAH